MKKVQIPINTKAIFFDGDGTTCSVFPSVTHFYRELITLSGFDVGSEIVSAALKKSWDHILPEYENKIGGFKTDQARETTIWHKFIRESLKAINYENYPSNLIENIYQRFARGDTRKVSPYFEELLVSLKKEGYFLGLFTNNDLRTHQVVSELGLRTYFDLITTAPELGYKKPSPQVFHSLCKLSKSAPNETLFIGDSPAHDFAGAKAAGCMAILYDPHQRHTHDPGQEPLESIGSFHDLLGK